jgi:hypothetical protein
MYKSDEWNPILLSDKLRYKISIKSSIFLAVTAIRVSGLKLNEFQISPVSTACFNYAIFLEFFTTQ